LRIYVFENPLGWDLGQSIGHHETNAYFAGDIVEIGEIFTHDECEGFVVV